MQYNLAVTVHRCLRSQAPTYQGGGGEGRGGEEGRGRVPGYYVPPGSRGARTVTVLLYKSTKHRLMISCQALVTENKIYIRGIEATLV